jgi:hypothetical protein
MRRKTSYRHGEKSLEKIERGNSLLNCRGTLFPKYGNGRPLKTRGKQSPFKIMGKNRFPFSAVNPSYKSWRRNPYQKYGGPLLCVEL